MDEGFQIIDIIFFAAIAGFILLRLRGALGRRTGHQPPPDQRRDDAGEANDNVVQLSERKQSEDTDTGFEDQDDDLDEGDQALSAGLAQIKAADGNFTRQGFLDGALGAFEIIIEAFADGDTARLRDLLDDDVYRPFTKVIDDRREAGHNHETMLVSIDDYNIIEAEMNGRIAVVTVRFVTQQINVTRDEDGEVVNGDPAKAATVTDLWTFERDSRSRSPNWRLVATRSPN